MSGTNRYAVNPPPRGPSWIQRNGKTVLIGAGIAGGVAVIGGLAYFIIEGLTGGSQPPACQALQNNLQAYQNELMAVYQQGAQQGGTYTGAQQSTIQDLQQSIANTIQQMSSVCVASPGTTLTETIDQIIVYSLWVAAAFVGIVAGAYAIRWLVKRWGGSGKNPGQPPTSADDVVVSDEFDASTVGSDAATAEVAQEFEEGSIDASDAASTASNLAAADPALGVYDTIAAFFQNAAAGATEAAAVLLDALAAAWDAITSALDALSTEFVLYFGF